MNLWVRGNNLIVKPRDGVRVDDAVDDVTAYLRGHRGLRPSDRTNFAVVTQDKLMDVYNQLFGTFFVVGIALSSVGLLVGGIGVIAIMMISVTERTREIGVRKALGATRGTILWQFLVEAVTLTGIRRRRRARPRHRRDGHRAHRVAVDPRVDAAVVGRVGARRERGHRRGVRHAAGDPRGAASIRSPRCATSSRCRSPSPDRSTGSTRVPETLFAAHAAKADGVRPARHRRAPRRRAS